MMVRRLTGFGEFNKVLTSAVLKGQEDLQCSWPLFKKKGMDVDQQCQRRRMDQIGEAIQCQVEARGTNWITII